MPPSLTSSPILPAVDKSKCACNSGHMKLKSNDSLVIMVDSSLYAWGVWEMRVGVAKVCYGRFGEPGRGDGRLGCPVCGKQTVAMMTDQGLRWGYCDACWTRVLDDEQADQASADEEPGG